MISMKILILRMRDCSGNAPSVGSSAAIDERWCEWGIAVPVWLGRRRTKLAWLDQALSDAGRRERMVRAARGGGIVRKWLRHAREGVRVGRSQEA